MITLTRDREIGPVLRTLRHDAGLSLRQLAHEAHLSPSGVQKREQSNASYVGILIQHAHVLGYDLALVPKPAAGTRPTGTGWPT